MSEKPTNTCLLLVFSAVFAISVILAYFTNEAEKVVVKIKFAEYDPEPIVFFWFMLSLVTVLISGACAVVMACFLIRDLRDKIYEEAVSRVEQRLQGEHTALIIERE